MIPIKKMFNKSYNTRNSGRFKTPGQFVAAAGEQQPFTGTPRRQQQPQQQQQSALQEVSMPDDVDMKVDLQDMDDGDVNVKQEDRPAWMKTKLAGVKKISNKERRRRQNETLRRLLTPKNALMVLNEMMPNDQIANQFKVEAAQNQYYSRNTHSFCADLSLEGSNYKGYGDNKLSARNSAAEQAIRDLIIKKMNKATAASTDGGEASPRGEELDEEALPMIQLASFALHKLFAEWEYEGHKVPQLKPAVLSPSPPGSEEPARPKKARAAKGPRTLPSNASSMHPCMLLTYMRPRLEYRELAADGDKPQNMIFTMGVDIDGATYIGKASNKKESRKAAARAACSALFGVTFEQGACAAAPDQ